VQVCSQGHAGLRQLAADAVVALVKASLEYKYDPPLKQQPVSGASALLILRVVDFWKQQNELKNVFYNATKYIGFLQIILNSLSRFTSSF
jgi:hypothetical protein